jgi:hypothetical protein
MADQTDTTVSADGTSVTPDPKDQQVQATDKTQHDAGDGGGEDTPKTFKKEYVDRLRSSADNAQKEAKELRAKLEAIEKAKLEETGQFKDLYEKEKAKAAEIEAARQADLSQADQRYIRAEVKAAAAAAGIQDPSDVALLDFSKFKINADGDVEGVTEAITALKASKPYLFKGTRQAAAVDVAGKPIPPVGGGEGEKKNAMDMTPEEWRKAWANVSKPKRVPA